MTSAASPIPPNGCDYVVVGAGIVGLAVARELTLRQTGASIAVLEAEERIGSHQTGHSSGVIHAGIYYKPGSLKARLCVGGAAELYGYCAERGIEARRQGKVIVATEPEELPRLDELERRGRENGVPELRRIDQDEIVELEPHAGGIAGLHSPATGVVDFGDVTAAFAHDIRSGGGTIATGCTVSRTDVTGEAIDVIHSLGTTRTTKLVVCAGAWSDRLAISAGADPDPQIVPFRGVYKRIRPGRESLVRTSIYPVPDPNLPFLGVHLTRDVHGEVHLGPSAHPVGARDAYLMRRVRRADLGETLRWPGTWRMAGQHWRYGIAELRRTFSKRALLREAQRYVPGLRAADLLPGGAGVRAQALARDGTLIDDFVVSETERAVHVRNAPSPAATSSIPLARLIADRVDALG
ncbi:MAG: L-2-hydroxyglutarate oxidase [Solirubrobacterales bacterium]